MGFLRGDTCGFCVAFSFQTIWRIMAVPWWRRGREIEAADEAADAIVGVGDGAAIEEAAGAEGLGEDGGEAFNFGGSGGRGFFESATEFGGGFGVADQFVEADGDGLAEVHRAMLGAGGDAQEPVAVAEIFVGQAGFFGAEEERDAICFCACGAFACETLQNVRAPASSVQS